ncbi:hypothetical protein BDQ17DRAFT_1367560 [Cyathus striatus]|nr:hypothetical protein BDQ17DRAFT_1367560 [Cyathus striatus]
MVRLLDSRTSLSVDSNASHKVDVYLCGPSRLARRKALKLIISCFYNICVFTVNRFSEVLVNSGRSHSWLLTFAALSSTVLKPEDTQEKSSLRVPLHLNRRLHASNGVDKEPTTLISDHATTSLCGNIENLDNGDLPMFLPDLFIRIVSWLLIPLQKKLSIEDAYSDSFFWIIEDCHCIGYG